MALQKEAESAILAFDVLLTLLDLASKRISELRQEGVITVEQQQARIDRINDIRQKVGPLPTPTPPPQP